MKPLKENKFLKWGYAYVDLGYKFLPIFFIFMFVPALLSLNAGGGYSSRDFDFFGLFMNVNCGTEANAISTVYPAVVILINTVVFVLLYLVLRLLTKFLKNVFDENPFIEENGRHLKKIGIIIIAGTVFIFLIKALTVPPPESKLITGLTPILLKLSMIVSIAINPFVFVGMLVIVIGEIILRGHKIKEEVDLTV